MTALQDMTTVELYNFMMWVQRSPLSSKRFSTLDEIDVEWDARMAYNPANKRWDG